MVERLGAYSWRLIGIGILAWATLELLGRLRLVVFPVLVALLITVVLTPPARWLRARGWRPLVAAWTVFLGFIGVLVLAGFLVVPAIADEFDDLAQTLEDGVEDIKVWLVDDSPFDVDRRRLDELQEQATDRLGDAVSGSGTVLVEGAVLLLEVAAGIVLALVVTFFLVKDGERFQAWGLARVPIEQRPTMRRVANRVWRTLGGYLRGSAMLGAVESAVISIALLGVGARLVVPVMVVTFLAAFVPFAGAAAAGVVAVLVALVTAGPVAALIVGVVALVVQQLDNDLLAPWVFGKALDLHPLVILLAIAAGSSLAGLAGAFLAVPLTAVVVNGLAELRTPEADPAPPPPLEAGGGTGPG